MRLFAHADQQAGTGCNGEGAGGGCLASERAWRAAQPEASGAQLLFGGFYLTSALALDMQNADSSGAPASGCATAKNFLPRKFLKRARPKRSEANQPPPAPGPLRPAPVPVTPFRPAPPTYRTAKESTPARPRQS